MGILRPPRTTILLLVAAFTVGIVVSGFLFGLAFYTPSRYGLGGLTASWGGGETYPAGAGTYEWKEEPLTGLETLNRMIIYTATLGLKVDNVDSAMNEIRNITKNYRRFYFMGVHVQEGWTENWGDDNSCSSGELPRCDYGDRNARRGGEQGYKGRGCD